MNSCNGQYSGLDPVAAITLPRKSSLNGESADTDPSPSRNASSMIQCTRSKLGFMPKSEPRVWNRSTVSRSPFGRRTSCAASRSATAATRSTSCG